MKTMNNSMVADERAAFEAWGNAHFNYGFYPSTWLTTEYDHEGTQMAWEGWQVRAALQAAPVQAQEPVAWVNEDEVRNKIKFGRTVTLKEKQSEWHHAAVYLAPVHSGVPDGWRIVPEYPTKEQYSAWENAPFSEDVDEEFRVGYNRMICAAPTPTAEQGDAKDFQRLNELYLLAMVDPFILPFSSKEKWLECIDRAINNRSLNISKETK